MCEPLLVDGKLERREEVPHRAQRVRPEVVVPDHDLLRPPCSSKASLPLPICLTYCLDNALRYLCTSFSESRSLSAHSSIPSCIQPPFLVASRTDAAKSLGCLTRSTIRLSGSAAISKGALPAPPGSLTIRYSSGITEGCEAHADRSTKSLKAPVHATRVGSPST
jgi:hypothetical protein